MANAIKVQKNIGKTTLADEMENYFNNKKNDEFELF